MKSYGLTRDNIICVNFHTKKNIIIDPFCHTQLYSSFPNLKALSIFYYSITFYKFIFAITNFPLFLLNGKGKKLSLLEVDWLFFLFGELLLLREGLKLFLYLHYSADSILNCVGNTGMLVELNIRFFSSNYYSFSNCRVFSI